jgi:bifunctional NMN adenylyltransferase/nudix hydrolase
MSTTGILIARFQTAQITENSKDAILGILQITSKHAIVLAINKSGVTRRNPIEIELRKQMVEEAFPEIIILEIEDHPSDKVWSEKLDKLLGEKFPGDDILIFGSDDNFIRRYHGKYNVRSTGKSKDPVPQPINATGPKIAFREGIIHGIQNTYPKVYPTVDVVVFRKEKKEILLGMKGIEKRWRFLGGFTDPDDLSYEEAARRELREECGLTDIGPLQYEASFRVDDWRYRYEDDKIMTILFSTDHSSGDAVGSDDIEEVKWFSLSTARELYENDQVASEHRPLFSFLLAKYMH